MGRFCAGKRSRAGLIKFGKEIYLGFNSATSEVSGAVNDSPEASAVSKARAPASSSRESVTSGLAVNVSGMALRLWAESEFSVFNSCQSGNTRICPSAAKQLHRLAFCNFGLSKQIRTSHPAIMAGYECDWQSGRNSPCNSQVRTGETLFNDGKPAG